MAAMAPYPPGTFDGFTQASIQDTFHFDTNQFLIPVDGECAPFDYDDLFSLLNQPANNPIPSNGGGSSEEAPPQRSADSDGWAASPAPAPAVTSAPLRQPSEPHPEPKPSKASRDLTSKRQLQVKELEALAAKKVEDLERLQQENSRLKFQSQILEKVVQMREQQLKIMRGQPEDLPQYWGCRAHQPLDGAAATSSAAAAGAGACPRAAAGEASGGHCGGGGGVSAVAEVRMASAGCLLASSRGGVSLSLSAEDRERFRSLGKSQLMDGWKHFLSEVAVPLLALESNGEDEQAAARIRQLATEATHLFKHASLLAPDTVMKVSQTHLETEALTPADPAHWRNVVNTLDLSPSQVRELVAVFRLFSGIMSGLLAERRTINQHLASGLHGHQVEMDVAAAMEQLRVSPECEVLQALQRSMRREKAAHLLLRGFLFGQTLSVLQFARAAVYSYPWMPDATAIVATVVEAAGEASGGA
ncbi:hypothetical protein PLESTM_000290400 [Pleodorina starrii]|nr:hypothetical protein PLESTM_000290400 [Pleodorina starrii]